MFDFLTREQQRQAERSQKTKQETAEQDKLAQEAQNLSQAINTYLAEKGLGQSVDVQVHTNTATLTYGDRSLRITVIHLGRYALNPQGGDGGSGGFNIDAFKKSFATNNVEENTMMDGVTDWLAAK